MVKIRGYINEKLRRSVRIYGKNFFSCWMKTFLLIFVITFIWLSCNYCSEQPVNNEKEIVYKNDNNISSHILVKNSVTVKKITQPEDKITTNEIREKVKQYNEEQRIINEEVYGLLSNDSLVIVVQVHNRIVYLKHLLESLSKAIKINEVLLIFSHDVYDEEINKLIQNITFCRVLQIFLPYSIQANPDKFPGNDPGDCPRDIGKEKALEIKCLGAENPDRYGHYRESKFTQIKHHWWWKANRVFNHLKVTKSYTGLVTFLEEDHYVTEDFIYMLRMMDPKCTEKGNCYFLGLGLHVNSYIHREFINGNQVKMSSLTTNLGLTFNRTTFNTILNCSKLFCEYDDYNWDWSLNHIVQTCHNMILQSMIPTGPRVFHTGECGIHIHKKNCNEESLILKIKDVLKDAKEQFYPSTITINDSPPKKTPMNENGGWGDKRDHDLCMKMTER